MNMLFFFSGIFLLLALLYYKKKQVEILRDLMPAFILEAEKIYGEGTGEMKYSLVFDWVYQSIPNFTKLIFTQQDLEYLIEVCLIYTRIRWENDSSLQKYLSVE